MNMKSRPLKNSSSLCFLGFLSPLWSRQQQQTKNRRIKRTRVPHSNTGNRRLKSRRVCAVVEGPRSWELPKRGGCYSDAQAPSSDGSMFVPPEKKKKRVLVAGVLLRHSNCSMIQNIVFNVFLTSSFYLSVKKKQLKMFSKGYPSELPIDYHRDDLSPRRTLDLN